MKNTWMLLLSGVALLVSTGCGIQGKWTLNTIDPESARGHFKLAHITLNSDGTYVAESEYKDAKMESETSKGTYEFKDGKLTFMPEKGEKRVYDAELTDMGNNLKVMSNSEHGDVTAVMKRD